MKKAAIATFVGLSLSGCATFSFAPPAIDIDNAVTARVGLGNRCIPVFKPRRDGTAGTVPINPNVDGARDLIDNFVHNYRCAASQAANGRQLTEVPSFLSLAGTTAAVALGAGPNVAIAGGAGSAILTQSGKYYAAQQKAEILNHSLDALLCIKAEAVGIDAPTLRAVSAVEKNLSVPQSAMRADGTPQPGAQVEISSEKQYFDMVSASLMSVERITALRLSIVGTPFDAAGVIAEIKALDEKIEEASSGVQAAANKTQTLKNAPVTDNGTLSAPSDQLRAKSVLNGIPSQQVANTLLRLDVLQPKLQQCVIRAKV